MEKKQQQKKTNEKYRTGINLSFRMHQYTELYEIGWKHLPVKVIQSNQTNVCCNLNVNKVNAELQSNFSAHYPWPVLHLKEKTPAKTE